MTCYNADVRTRIDEPYPPDQLEDDRGTYEIEEVPLESITAFETCLRGAKFTASGSWEERRDAIEAQANELVSKAEIDGIEATCVNGSEPYGPIWHPVRGAFVIHPRYVQSRNVIAVGTYEKSGSTRWVQPRIHLTRTPCDSVRAQFELWTSVQDAARSGARVRRATKKAGAKAAGSGRQRRSR